METYIAYAVIAVLSAVSLWLALEWHRAKEERDDTLVQLLETEADLDTLEWYTKRALTAEARVKELEGQLNRYTVSVPSCWATATFCPNSTLTIGGTGGTIQTALIDTLVPQVVQAVQQ